MKSIFNVNSDIVERDGAVGLRILSCGIHKDVDRKMEIVRPNGTKDFHLLFAAHGCIRSFARTASDHQGFFFYPNERQEYIYGTGEGTLYYWIHFVGADATEYLGEDFSRRFDYAAHCAEVNAMLQMLISATAHRENYRKDYAEILLRALLALLSSKTTVSRFSKVLTMMRDFSKTYTLADYANACAMSEEHFIRRFKGETGSSPMAYRSELQNEQAKQLLIHTSLPIAMVAELSGFDDAMYFSRAFKKRTGLSPTEYRRQFS